MRTQLLLLAVLASAGCLRDTSYRCTDTAQCGGGTCEDTGFCSFADTTCADSGRRYGEFSGSYANQCVGGSQPGEDAGVDSSIDAPPGDNCPSTYTTIAGITNRRYRVIANMAAWSVQQAACAADGNNVYLAVPDDQTELTALVTASGSATTWVGIHDETAEGTYVTSAGGSIAANSPLWANGEPDNGPISGGGPNNADCVAATASGLADDRCTSTYRAVCECQP